MFIGVHAGALSRAGSPIYRSSSPRHGQRSDVIGTIERERRKASTMVDEEHSESTDENAGEDPVPQDGLPSPSKWRKRMGLAGVASVGGVVAWLFGRRDKPPTT
jgi:hypothetical protein